MTEQNPQTPARTRLDLIRRPRRLRTNPAMRDIVAETRLHPEDMIQVLFVRDGIDAPQEIPSMPGQHQHTVESLVRAVGEAVAAGVRCIDLFGVPLDADKDAEGSAAWAEDGILNRGIRAVHDEFGDDVVIMADTCLDEFTSHGHCGPLTQNRFGTTVVDNDASVAAYCRMAVSQARAGAHVVSPSGMMDGQIAAIRQALDEEGFEEVSIMAYSAKYASAFFGPFRDAVGSSLQGDRKTYQQDPANSREGVKEADLDELEGADLQPEPQPPSGEAPQPDETTTEPEPSAVSAEPAGKRNWWSRLTAGDAEEAVPAEAHVVEEQLGGVLTVHAEFLQLLAALETGHAALDQEGGDPARSLARLRVHDQRVGIGRVGDPEFGAVQNVAITLLFGAGAHRHDVRARSRFGHGQRADVFAADQLGQIFLLLLFGAVHGNQRQRHGGIDHQAE